MLYYKYRKILLILFIIYDYKTRFDGKKGKI